MLRNLPAGRLVDVLAVLAIAFVAYRIFIAPRNFSLKTAHPAPRVAYATLDGPRFELARHRGRLVFLDFYASWCEPCRISLPLVERYARSHPEVDVVPIDVGEPAPVAAAFAKRYDLHNVALDPSALSNGFFQIRGFPTMVVVDPQGRVRASWEGLNPAVQINMGHAQASLARR
ncbi:MAG: TlpA family protein disulfide reductase [Candidatus Baltobacteraceae bacterium]